VDEPGTTHEANEADEYTRFENLARKLVNTPKPTSSAEDLPPSSREPADDSPEREEDDGDGR